MNRICELSSTGNLIEFHQRKNDETYQDDEHLASMAMNSRYAKLVQISDIPEHELSGLRRFIVPTFCYQNAFDTAKMLNATHIVYGLALNFFSELCISAEHAWLRLADGKMVDPTYQVASESAAILADKVTYYSLFEVPINQYAEFAAELGFTYGKYIAMDFAYIRRSKQHRFLFSVSRG
ncbi:hypothetical protein OCF84_21535 (plasmid) [Shewanella xiamenensis]|uniref:Uncharacterized protein n=3 Tax=Shewanella xiamenensis TaxID=332186 RepID=A0ABT6UFM7_9GAMM|nr:hypothetical protein [Shewanella xiamenensis]MDI5832540.1 hypothetical protein [Shewanella xiamenensis]WHF57842.1 hypothetical protein OCF84_21535 [Shewanella xiamenensis]